jgi:hypothetical protein
VLWWRLQLLPGRLGRLSGLWQPPINNGQPSVSDHQPFGIRRENSKKKLIKKQQICLIN